MEAGGVLHAVRLRVQRGQHRAISASSGRAFLLDGDRGNLWGSIQKSMTHMIMILEASILRLSEEGVLLYWEGYFVGFVCIEVMIHIISYGVNIGYLMGRVKEKKIYGPCFRI